MFVNRKFSKELLREFRDLNLSWIAQTDISVAEDDEFLKELRKNGCRILFIGFESVSKKNLAGINKNNWKEDKYNNYGKYIDIIQRNGIGIYGAFIIGFDEDNEHTADEISNFVNDNNLLGAQITILTPHPGSRLRERLRKENRIITDDWDYYTTWDAVIKHNNLTTKQLENSLMNIYKSIYNYDRVNSKALYFKKIFEKLA